MLKRSLGISFLGLMAFSMAATTQESVVLRRQLVEGNTDTYTIESSTDMALDIPGQGKTDMKSTFSTLYTTKIGKVDSAKGLADFETLMTDIKFKMEGAMAGNMGEGAEPPKEVKSVGKIDARGRQSDMKVQGLNGQMLMAMSSSALAGDVFFAFPETAVKPGDTWDVMTPKMPQFGNKEFKLTAKYIGDEAVGAVKAMKVTLSGTITLDVNISEMMKQMGTQDPTGGMLDSMQPMLRGDIVVGGTAFFDKANGRPITVESTMDMKTRMELSSVGMTIDAPGKSKSTMKLKK